MAQINEPVKGNFTHLNFKSFVEKIESEYGYHFYYENNELDTLQVNIQSNDLPLETLLQQILSQTIYHYAIDKNKRVFITKNTSIATQLPKDYFETNTLDNEKQIEGNIIANNTFISNPGAENKSLEIGNSLPGNKTDATIAGYIRDAKTGETISGAAIFIDTPSIGTVTDQYGYYSLTLPKGTHTLHISGIGMQEQLTSIFLKGDGKLDIELREYIPSLKGVIVSANKQSNLRNIQMGVEKLSIQTIRKVPVIFGESDLLRVVMTLPGVTSVGEASTGFNVRGGAADQNLVLFNDATIYNPSHLFGFFAAFNPDVVKGIELYKSGIPEKFGGRLSSVLDVTVKEGNSKKISGVAGIGLLTSKLTIEGPIAKEKTTFVLGGRTTYSNWLLKQVPRDAYKNSKASFADGNMHIHHALNSKNAIYLLGYLSTDRFNLRSDTTYRYGNKNVNIKWKHIFNNQLNSTLTAGFDHYFYNITGDTKSIEGYQLGFSINQPHFRANFNWQPNAKHSLNFGIHSVYYQLQPGNFQPAGNTSLIIPKKLNKEQGLENAIYLGDKINVSSKLSVNAGIRYSLFHFMGPNTVYEYAKDVPRDTATITGSSFFKKGSFINTYHGPEFRLAALYKINNQSSAKISFNSLRQYIHVLSNTTAISPTDIYKLSDPNIRPQQGYQVSAGYYRNFNLNTIETSVEVYYKKLQHYLDYKSGADLLMNQHIETDVINTSGKAYGIELLIKKTTGIINGWISYTYSRTLLKTDDPIAGENINNGKYYPANFDKPHIVNFIGNYRFSHRFSASLNVVYNTGRPITLPLALFNMGGSQRLYYSQRNEYRIPDYFRTDISFTLEGNHKVNQKTHNSWSAGVYNLTGRDNAYSVYFAQENGTIKGYQLSIFGTLIPFITFNVKF